MTKFPQQMKLSITSWNINDSKDSILGDKTSNTNFVNKFSNCDVFCLQETKGNVKIPNFRCFNSLRSNSRSGGICIGVRQDICHHIKLLNTSKYSPDIQAIEIPRKLTGLDSNIVLINIYDSPENSSYKVKLNNSGNYKETIVLLNEYCSSLPKNCHVILAGDFNARTNNLNSLSENNNILLQKLQDGRFNRASHSMPNTRNSKDNVANERGKKLIDFATEWNLTILNGSTIGDIRGEWTCMRYNGQSVVDYLLVSHILKNNVTSMKILDFNEFSDHRPVCCDIKCTSATLYSNGKPDVNFDPKPNGFRWQTNNDESKLSYLNTQHRSETINLLASISNNNCNNESEVLQLNDTLVRAIMEIAGNSLERRKTPNKRRDGKNSWYDYECRLTKRKLQKATKNYIKCPTNAANRDLYYSQRKQYRSLLKYKKNQFYAKLNRDIEEAASINWTSFKRLKSSYDESDKLDLYDLTNFYNFFKDLYSKQTLDNNKISEFQSATTGEINHNSKPIDHCDEIDKLINNDISRNELDEAISKLKKGKAIGEDCISNEFLIHSSSHLRIALLKLFNECLKNGIYPWSTSIITPLHKKGDLANPDNYRAIAVCSALGKCFSNILLSRLMVYRHQNCPDPPNQLGFCKMAQTSDHIFTLSTCINKYLKQKKRLYSCFIDFRKAFDTVCREALLFKLCKLGIQGRFFSCLTYMYTHSKAKIKLLNKLSKSMDVLIGTEQGHPMSPELFKCYLLDLSVDLNSVLDIELPDLNGNNVSHLLWADDLVLMALDRISLQRLIDVVSNYCTEWGLTVNIDKTAIMIFNNSGRQLKESSTFHYGKICVPAAIRYCYLGIVFSLNGGYTVARDELRKKGLCAYFSLKKLVDISELSVKCMFKLFDALILPVASYGCQVWLPHSVLFKLIASGKVSSNPTDSLKKISTDPLERIHLKFLKWTLKVHSKTSNIACWGDSGRVPLVIQLTKQYFDYFKRLELFDQLDSSCLVRHAFVEQRDLLLPWYDNASKFANNINLSINSSTSEMKETTKNLFGDLWLSSAILSTKLRFYTKVKTSIGYEPYLSLRDPNKRKCIAQLRSSSHRLNIETGRYINRHIPSSENTKEWYQRCEFCTESSMELLHNLPYADIIIEDERHFLVTCPNYHHIRHNLPDNIKSALLTWDDDQIQALFSELYVKDFATYVLNIFKIRLS